MSSKDRQLVPIRLYPDDYKKIKAKIQDDGITFQKLAEILFKMYLKGNNQIDKTVKKYATEKEDKKRRYPLTEFEADEILRRIELDSPLQELDEAFDEFEKEER